MLCGVRSQPIILSQTRCKTAVSREGNRSLATVPGYIYLRTVRVVIRIRHRSILKGHAVAVTYTDVAHMGWRGSLLICCLLLWSPLFASLCLRFFTLFVLSPRDGKNEWKEKAGCGRDSVSIRSRNHYLYVPVTVPVSVPAAAAPCSGPVRG